MTENSSNYGNCVLNRGSCIVRSCTVRPTDKKRDSPTDACCFSSLQFKPRSAGELILICALEHAQKETQYGH